MVNILDLLQQYQGMQGQPSTLGPIMPQNPTPGFRAPAPMQMAVPRPQDPGMGLGQGLSQLGMGIAALRKSHDPTNPGVPTPQGDPTGGAGPAYLGGTSPLGNINQPVDPNVLNPSSGIIGWLKGLF